MYNAQLTIERIQTMIKQNGLTQKKVLSDCGISENTLKRMTDNKGMSSFYLAKIADYLGCSVDYLLGRTENSVTENGEFSKEEIDLIYIYRELSGQGQNYIKQQFYVAQSLYKKEQGIHQLVGQT